MLNTALYIAENESSQRAGLIVGMINGGEDTECAVYNWWKHQLLATVGQPNLTTPSTRIFTSQFTQPFS